MLLTERQLDVVRLLSVGCEQKEIARRLGIKRNTVKLHTAAIYGRLGVNTAAGAVGEAMRKGLIE